MARVELPARVTCRRVDDSPSDVLGAGALVLNRTRVLAANYRQPLQHTPGAAVDVLLRGGARVERRSSAPEWVPPESHPYGPRARRARETMERLRDARARERARRTLVEVPPAPRRGHAARSRSTARGRLSKHAPSTRHSTSEAAQRSSAASTRLSDEAKELAALPLEELLARSASRRAALLPAAAHSGDEDATAGPVAERAQSAPAVELSGWTTITGSQAMLSDVPTPSSRPAEAGVDAPPSQPAAGRATSPLCAGSACCALSAAAGSQRVSLEPRRPLAAVPPAPARALSQTLLAIERAAERDRTVANRRSSARQSSLGMAAGGAPRESGAGSARAPARQACARISEAATAANQRASAASEPAKPLPRSSGDAVRPGAHVPRRASQPEPAAAPARSAVGKAPRSRAALRTHAAPWHVHATRASSSSARSAGKKAPRTAASRRRRLGERAGGGSASAPMSVPLSQQLALPLPARDSGAFVGFSVAAAAKPAAHTTASPAAEEPESAPSAAQAGPTRAGASAVASVVGLPSKPQVPAVASSANPGAERPWRPPPPPAVRPPPQAPAAGGSRLELEASRARQLQASRRLSVEQRAAAVQFMREKHRQRRELDAEARERREQEQRNRRAALEQLRRFHAARKTGMRAAVHSEHVGGAPATRSTTTPAAPAGPAPPAPPHADGQKPPLAPQRDGLPTMRVPPAASRTTMGSGSSGESAAIAEPPTCHAPKDGSQVASTAASRSSLGAAPHTVQPAHAGTDAPADSLQARIDASVAVAMQRLGACASSGPRMASPSATRAGADATPVAPTFGTHGAAVLNASAFPRLTGLSPHADHVDALATCVLDSLMRGALRTLGMGASTAAVGPPPHARIPFPAERTQCVVAAAHSTTADPTLAEPRRDSGVSTTSTAQHDTIASTPSSMRTTDDPEVSAVAPTPTSPHRAPPPSARPTSPPPHNIPSPPISPTVVPTLTPSFLARRREAEQSGHAAATSPAASSRLPTARLSPTSHATAAPSGLCRVASPSSPPSPGSPWRSELHHSPSVPAGTDMNAKGALIAMMPSPGTVARDQLRHDASGSVEPASNQGDPHPGPNIPWATPNLATLASITPEGPRGGGSAKVSCADACTARTSARARKAMAYRRRARDVPYRCARRCFLPHCTT